jgi:Ca-activated chloride channel family protein
MNIYTLAIALLILLLAGCARERVVEAPGDEADTAAERPTRTKVGEAEKFAVMPSHKRMASADMAISSPYLRQFAAIETDRENYLSYDSNGVLRVVETPVSTFSIDVDTAAYSNMRRMLLREGRLPPTDAVRIEEYINYFDYSYDIPAASDAPFTLATEIAPAPWNSRTHLLKVGLKGFQPGLQERPAANLVFLIDVSGSMQSPQKLGLVKNALRLLVKQLDENDRVALVVYAGAAGQVLESTPGDQQHKILSAINGLEAGGSTNGGAGIQLAYDIAARHFLDGGINRVLIASDGDMNVGTTGMEALKDLVAREKVRGIALTTLGFGTGNYNYALMEQLADVGDGNAAYIDSLKEAHKVLVTQMSSTLNTIARDVKIQVEFNPETVAEYRLIGYENRMLQREDFTNDKVDAGDIGVGHSVTALYEVSLVGSGSERILPLRYQSTSEKNAASSTGPELAQVRLRYKLPQGGPSTEVTRVVSRTDIIDSTGQASEDFRFAASVAGFAQLLQGGQYTGGWSYDEALQLARNARGSDPHGYRGEMLALVELSRDLTVGPTTQ